MKLRDFEGKLNALIRNALDADVPVGPMVAKLHRAAGIVDKVFIEGTGPSGFYWVRHDGEIVIAELVHDRWFRCGGEVELNNDSVGIISGPLVAPQSS